jgi:hypothetical protein
LETIFEGNSTVLDYYFVGIIRGCQPKNKTSQTKTTQSEQKRKPKKQQLTFSKGMPKK